MNKFIRALLILLATGCIVFAAIPILLYQIFNTGVAALLVLAVLLITEACLLRDSRRNPWEVFARKGGGVIVARRLIAVLLTLFAIAEVAMSVVMLRPALAGGTPAQAGATAVVLGGGIREDQPKLVLQRRLEQALLYLNANPAAKVVVTGGLDNKYPYTEAYVEHKWLTERGIASERIILEDKSRDTYQNLQYTVLLLGQNGLPNDMIIFTDTFHQLRGQLYARLAVGGTAGEDLATQRTRFFDTGVSGVGSNTPWGLVPCYWLREQAGLVEAFLLTDIHKMYI